MAKVTRNTRSKTEDSRAGYSFEQVEKALDLADRIQDRIERLKVRWGWFAIAMAALILIFNVVFLNSREFQRLFGDFALLYYVVVNIFLVLYIPSIEAIFFTLV